MVENLDLNNYESFIYQQNSVIIKNILNSFHNYISINEPLITNNLKCNDVIKLRYFEYLKNFGNEYLKRKLYNEAKECFVEALYHVDDDLTCLNNLGLALIKLGKFAEAKQILAKALEISPDLPQILNNYSLTLKEEGNLSQSIEILNRIISKHPDYISAKNNLGLIYSDKRQFAKALKIFFEILSINSMYSEAYRNISKIYNLTEQFDKAIKTSEQAATKFPDMSFPFNSLGISYYKLGEYNKSLDYLKKAIIINNQDFDCYNNLGNTLHRQVKLEEAIAAFKKAISLNPYYYQAYNNTGNVLKDKGKIDEAIVAYKKAIFIKPTYAEAHQNLSFALLNNGNIKEGLGEYEWRWKVSTLLKKRIFLQPEWDGKKSLKGKRILLWYEQGLGDIINWSSYLNLISSKVDHCILECQDKLVPLLKRSFPNIEVKHENRSLDSKRSDFDFHLPMGSIYKHFIQEISQNPKPKKFLKADPDRVSFWKKRLYSIGKGPYIGISWKSSNMSHDRLQNYASISEWSDIFKVSDVTFINLQYNNFADDLTKIEDEFDVKVHNFNDLDHFNNIDDVAALCAALDIVVSIKNTIPFISVGVGTLTKLANWKQSNWNNVLLNPYGSSVEIYERNTWEKWKKLFHSIAKTINNKKRIIST